MEEVNFLHELNSENTPVGDTNLARDEISLTFIPVLFPLMDRRIIVF